MNVELPSKWQRYNEALWLSARLWRGMGHSRVRGPEEGQPVLVIPGFMTSDRSALELRRALAEAGFRVYPWQLGINKGVSKELYKQLLDRVDEIHEIHKEPVLLVGWSLGGLFAREIARDMPEKIEAVVTLGSPIALSLRDNNVWRIYEWITGHAVDQTPVPRICAKPPVPTLAIWSKNDGLIPADAARGTELERDDEIEMSCTHMAFGLSYLTTRKIASFIKEWLKK